MIDSEPQIASLGATEDELVEEGREYVVGRAEYADTAMGRAKELEEGFARGNPAPDGENPGCHVFGHEASVLVHEAVVATHTGASVADTIHVRPTLGEVIAPAFEDASQGVSE